MAIDPALAIARAAQRLGDVLGRGGWILRTAESCTAGGVAYAVTTVAGSSAWFDRGYVVYTNAAKIEELGVPEPLLAQFGAVSEPVAQAMALGALGQPRAGAGEASRDPVGLALPPARRISVAVSGIAGPGGATPGKPVGTVCFGFALATAAGHEVQQFTRHFRGDRAAVRTASILCALAHVARLAGRT